MALFTKSNHTKKLKKWDIRLRYLEVRELISKERREEASKRLFLFLMEKVKGYKHVLSFMSAPSEISMDNINAFLCHNKALLLPKVGDTGLKIYHVADLEKQLILSKWGIYEPDPTVCKPAKLSSIECAIIPGVAFDHEKNRIGFGKGYYDQLLKDLHKPPFWGVGFKEQLYFERIPTCPHDIKMDEIFLF